MAGKGALCAGGGTPSEPCAGNFQAWGAGGGARGAETP